MASTATKRGKLSGDPGADPADYAHLPEFTQPPRRFDPDGFVWAPDPQQIRQMTSVLRRLRLERKRATVHRPDAGADLDRAAWEDDE